MASSRNSPGPKDRKPGNPRQKCIAQNRNGKPCSFYAVRGTKLCRLHAEKAANRQSRIVPDEDYQPPTESEKTKGRLNKKLKDQVLEELDSPDSDTITTSKRHNQHKSLSVFVISEQSKQALANLGLQNDDADPKRALLDTVYSAWRQRQIWEGMLNSIPEEDWQYVGMPPIPGHLPSIKGARIEVIQRNLDAATKTAARVSKMALDAGIDERLVRLAEEQAALIADTVRAALIAGISLLAKQGIISPEAEKAAIETAVNSAADHLRLLASGEAPGSTPSVQVIEGTGEVVRVGE